MVYKKGYQSAKDFARAWATSVSNAPVEVYGLTAVCLSGVLLVTLFLRSYTLLHSQRPHRFSLSGADVWVASLFADDFSGYFLDIGGCTDWSTSNTRMLEERGWEGMCADPFPRRDDMRTCGFITQAIGGEMHQPASLSNCTARARNGSAPAVDLVREEDCPRVQVTTYGIGEFLHLVEAPHVIHYISLGVTATSAQILQEFPWQRFCVKHWTIRPHPDSRLEVRSILLGHGCQIGEAHFETWASCECEVHPARPPAAPPAILTEIFDGSTQRVADMQEEGATHASGVISSTRLARAIPNSGEHAHSRSVSVPAFHHHRDPNDQKQPHSKGRHKHMAAAEFNAGPHRHVKGTGAHGHTISTAVHVHRSS